MATDDKKRYNYMENVLQQIQRKYISLPDDEVARNNKILISILKAIVEKMKEKDPLFKKMYSNVFYGGSFYDGLRVGQPEEYDLDLLLSLPKYAEPNLTNSNMPGYMHLQLKKLNEFLKQPEAVSYKNFAKLFDEKKHFLDTKQVLAWMEGTLTKALNDFPKNGTKSVIKNELGTFEIIVKKGGPALTLFVTETAKMNIDLVPCFVFREDKWPQTPFKKNPVKNKPEFFIVPKEPKNCPTPSISTRFWRLSFQMQERVLIDGKSNLKPTVKFLKKLRNSLNHDTIASYYIKTVVLHICDKKDDAFWKNSLSYVFMTVLKEYRENYIERGVIPYYWNKNNNLLGGMSICTLVNMNNRLKFVINDIERNASDPTIIAKYLLTDKEYMAFLLGSIKL